MYDTTEQQLKQALMGVKQKTKNSWMPFPCSLRPFRCHYAKTCLRVILGTLNPNRQILTDRNNLLAWLFVVSSQIHNSTGVWGVVPKTWATTPAKLGQNGLEKVGVEGGGDTKDPRLTAGNGWDWAVLKVPRSLTVWIFATKNEKGKKDKILKKTISW